MPIKPMRLIDYLNMFSWSQADLAREAGVSTHCVSRAIHGKKIARRNAQKIIEALTRQFRLQGGNAHIGRGSIQGLQIADVQQKTARPRQPQKSLHGEQPASDATKTNE